MENTELREWMGQSLERLQDTLDRMSDKMDQKHEKLNDKIDELRYTQVEQAKDLAQIKSDMPEMKMNLKAHEAQDQVTAQALESFRQDVRPTVEHVAMLQALPAKLAKGIITVSKVMAAIVVCSTALGGILASCTTLFKHP